MRSLFVFSLSIALVALVACDPDSTATRSKPDMTKPPPVAIPGDPASPEGQAQEAKKEEPPPYAYNPIGKRDPFRTYFRVLTDNNIPNPTPLQLFDLEQFTLVGVVWGVENGKAMVEDPDSVGHIVELGTYIGKNWGRVTAINPDGVMVTEEFRTPTGDLITETHKIGFPADDGRKR